jgi:hypothetical protein
MARISLDKRFERDRQLMLAGRPSSFARGVKRGGIAFIRGAVLGCTGRDPCRLWATSMC